MPSKNGKITLVLRVAPETARIITKVAGAFEEWSVEKTNKKLKGITIQKRINDDYITNDK